MTAASLWALPFAVHAAEAVLDFTPTELRRIQSHGPWPPAALHARDPSNKLSGKPQAMALGQRLFFDVRLSIDGRMACATCHVPGLAFGDVQARAVGRETLSRNTPSLWNAVHHRWWGWDGAFDSLWSQAIAPLTHPQEMASSGAHLRQLLQSDAELSCRYQKSLSRQPAADSDETVLVSVAKALGAFVGSLQSGPTPFDQFAKAMQRGDRKAAVRYPLQAQRGLRLFVGQGQCSTCHHGPLFSNGEFADIGVPFFIRPGVVDAGRHGGIEQLRASRYNLLSPWNDAADAPSRVKTQHLAPAHRNFGEFKVPSLRNVAETAPYMHDGQLATLEAVVRHYSELNLDRLHADGEQILRPLKLSEAEVADLVAFLRTLSDPKARQWKPREFPRCVTKP
ncbi:MAG: cytochrome-c peroxidase [Burkholderiales bacterium]